MRLESDLVEAMEASIDGRTSDGDFKWSNDAAVCVVMASGGYPGATRRARRSLASTTREISWRKSLPCWHVET